MVHFRGRFSPIEAVLTRLANKASKEVPTKSGGNLTEKVPLAKLNTASYFGHNSFKSMWYHSSATWPLVQLKDDYMFITGALHMASANIFAAIPAPIRIWNRY